MPAKQCASLISVHLETVLKGQFANAGQRIAKIVTVILFYFFFTFWFSHLFFSTPRDNINKTPTAPSTCAEGACRSLSTSSEESGSGGWAQVAPDEDPQEETTCSFIHLSEGSVFQYPIMPFKPLKLQALNANGNHGFEGSFQGSFWQSIDTTCAKC